MHSRDLFTELSAALVEARAHSEGKQTLKTQQIEVVGKMHISPEEIVSIREQFQMSRGVFARLLRISARTLLGDTWFEKLKCLKKNLISFFLESVREIFADFFDLRNFWPNLYLAEFWPLDLRK